MKSLAVSLLISASVDEGGNGASRNLKTPKEENHETTSLQNHDPVGSLRHIGGDFRLRTSWRPAAGELPFDFIVGSQTLPAGRYILERINRQTIQETVVLRTADGHAIMMVRMMPAQARSKQEQARLIFQRYGHRYFLSQLVTLGDDFGLKLPKSRLERKLERELVGSNQTKFTASVTVALGQAKR